MHHRRSVRAALFLAPVLTIAACGSDGEVSGDAAAAAAPADYPTESIDLIVPFAAGGPTDLAGRTVGSCLEDSFGQTVVVENRVGASGAAGMQAMVEAGGDGYTLQLLAVPAQALNPLQQDVGYTNEDYVPIAAVTEIPSVLAVGPDSRFADAEALFEFAAANPGELNIAVPGATTSQAMELERLAALYDVEVTAVPFTGNAEIVTALLGGNVDAMFSNASGEILENIDAGSFVPLAVSSPERVDYIDAPTLAESGFPELVNSVSLFGLAAPAGVPEEVVTALEGAVETCVQQEATIETLGEQYVPDEFIDSETFQARIDDMVEAYGPILQD